MFVVQFLFEWRQWFRAKTFWMYATCFYLFAALTMAGAAGMFGEGSVSKEGLANAPHSLFSLSAFFTRLLLLVVPAIAGTTLLRERNHNIHGLFFSYPVRKQAFLWAKIAAIFCLLFVLACCILAGFVTGIMVAKNFQVQWPISWETLGAILFGFMVPVLLEGIALVFFIVAVTKNMYNGFVFMLCFWVLSEITGRLAALPIFQILGDPTGDNLVTKSVLFLTQPEKNNLPLIFPTEYAWNRLWWFLVSGLFLYLAQRYYLSKDFFAIENIRNKVAVPQVEKVKATLHTPVFQFDWLARTKLTCSFGWQEAKYIIKDPLFILLNAIGGIWLVVYLMSPQPQTQMLMVPVSAIALGYPIFFYSFMVLLLTFLYAGMVLNRARIAGIADLLSTTPAPDWVFVVGKWLGLVFMQIVIMLFLTVVISGVQVFSGYPVARPVFTFTTLLAIHLPGFIIWAMLAIMVQSFTANTFTGLFVLIMVTLGLYQLADIGVESPLLRFNAVPEPDFYFRYSDLAGYGGSLPSFFAHRLYWLLAGVLLLLLSIPFAQREHTGHVKERFRLAGAKMKANWPVKFFAFVAVGLFVIAWSIIGLLNAKPPVVKQADEVEVLSDFKAAFAPYLAQKQPVIMNLKAEISIKSGESFEVNGMYTLKNNHSFNMDTLLVRSSFQDQTFFEWNGLAEKIDSNEMVKVMVVHLNKPLLPGDSLEIKFRVIHANNNDYEPNERITQNGIYISSSVFPRIGWRDGEFPADSLQKDYHYQGNDEHGLLTDITIKTALDQRAFAPGNLVSEHTSENQKMYRYKTSEPVKFSFAILSGKYAQRADTIGSSQLSIWHHPAHTYSLDNMMRGLKSSIAYHEKWFSPLQFDTIRMIEFARPYGTFATLAANGIPVSEIRFLQDTNHLHQKGTDLGFYVMAHEMSHHWWGNQLQPAHAPGAAMLTESLAEYVSLKVYEAHYGRARALGFLAIQKNRYLSGRAQAGKQERALLQAGEGDEYLVYGKGALAFYRLADLWGEENLNKLLQNFLQTNAMQKPPYPTARDLLNAIYRASPVNLHAFIHDAFESTDWHALEKHLSGYNLP